MPEYNMYSKPITEEINEIKARLKLLENDKKAYKESLNEAFDDCKKRIKELRRENDVLRKDLFTVSNTSQKVTEQAFQRNNEDKILLMNYPNEKAEEIMDSKTGHHLKKWNLLKYESDCKIKKMESILNKYEHLNEDVQYIEDMKKGLNKDGQEIRDIDNRIDKAFLKCSEAGQIHTNYVKIRDKLKEESLHYQNDLNNMESEIKKGQKQLSELKIIEHDAEVAKKHAQNELREQEIISIQDRKKRELESLQMKSNLEEKQAHVAKPITDESSSVNHTLLDGDVHEDQKSKLKKYENIRKDIQEVTGTLSLDDLVNSFQDQKLTETNLMLKIENTRFQCISLKREKNKMLHIYNRDQFDWDEKSFKNSELLLEIEDYYKNSIKRNEYLNEKLKERFFVLVLCKLCLENLVEMLGEEMDDCSEEYEENELFNNLNVIKNQASKMNEQQNSILIKPKIFLESFSEFINDVYNQISEFNQRIDITRKNTEIDMPTGVINEDSFAIDRMKRKKQSLQIVESKLKKSDNKKKKKKGK